MQQVGEIYKALHNAERAIRELPLVKGDAAGVAEFTDALNATLPSSDAERAVFGAIRMLDSYTPEILGFLKSMRRTAFSMWTCPENIARYLGIHKQWVLEYDIDAVRYVVKRPRSRRSAKAGAKRGEGAAMRPINSAEIMKKLRDVGPPAAEGAPKIRSWASVAKPALADSPAPTDAPAPTVAPAPVIAPVIAPAPVRAPKADVVRAETHAPREQKTAAPGGTEPGPSAPVTFKELTICAHPPFAVVWQ